MSRPRTVAHLRAEGAYPEPGGRGGFRMRRSTSPLIAALAALAMWGGACEAGDGTVRSASPGPSRTTGGGPAAGNEASGFAVGGGLHAEGPATLDRDLDALVAAHSGWIRLDLNWAVIQAAGPSHYDWAPFDRVVTSARSRGLRVLAVLLYTPEWERPSGAPPTHGPDPERFAAFSRAAVERYAPLGVHHYEIWNEPNVPEFWSPAPDPAAYTRLLRAAYPAIRAADPHAVVVTGGTAPAPSDGRSMSPVDFLAAVYAQGGHGSFDAVGHHPYCAPARPGEAHGWSAWYQMYGTSPSLRSTMVANGDEQKEIWATEFGAPTDGPPGQFVSEATQAGMVTRAYELFRRYSWAGPLFWYTARDQGAAASGREGFFGLLRNDFSRKPGFAAYRAVAARAID